MTTVLVFSTSIKKEKDALNIAHLLSNYFSLKSAHFDLDDAEKILRAEGRNIRAEKIKKTLFLFGHKCKELI